jgi:hypothetical protein
MHALKMVDDLELKTMQALLAVLMLVPDELGHRCVFKIFEECYEKSPEHIKMSMKCLVNG